VARPAIVIALPPSERTVVADELRSAGFEAIVVGSHEELEALLAVRRDISVAILDGENDLNETLEFYGLLHEGSREIPALMVMSPKALDKMWSATSSDEFFSRPYTADSIRWRVEAMCIRSVTVDDGSGPDYAHVFEAVRADFGVELLVHSKNMGKGCALKTAFEYCSTTAPEITCVVTADSDGQHSPEDIEAVANRLLDNRASATTAAVLGVRDFSGAGVPWKSRLGNRLTSGLVRILFGRRVTDTQTGLRGFPAELLTLLESVRGNRFEYEMNSLMALMRHCINVQEVGIQTIYHDMQNSQSHFRPLIDSMRIYAQILRFGASSLVGAAVDLTLFALFVSVLYGGSRNAQGIVIAIVLARIGSAAVNYWLNRGFGFHEKAKARL